MTALLMSASDLRELFELQEKARKRQEDLLAVAARELQNQNWTATEVRGYQTATEIKWKQEAEKQQLREQLYWAKRAQQEQNEYLKVLGASAPAKKSPPGPTEHALDLEPARPIGEVKPDKRILDLD